MHKRFKDIWRDVMVPQVAELLLDVGGGEPRATGIDAGHGSFHGGSGVGGKSWWACPQTMGGSNTRPRRAREINGKASTHTCARMWQQGMGAQVADSGKTILSFAAPIIITTAHSMMMWPGNGKLAMDSRQTGQELQQQE